MNFKNICIFIVMFILTIMTVIVWTRAIHEANISLCFMAIGLSGILVICIIKEEQI